MKNIKTVLLLELVVFMVAFCWMLLVTGGNPLNLLYLFIDLPSLIGLLLLTIPALIVSGQGKDFIKSFSVGKKEYSLLELKNICGAIASAQKLVVYAGLVMFVIGFVIIMTQLEHPEVIGPNVAVCSLSVFYTIVFQFFLLPLKVNVARTINRIMDFEDEE